MTSLAKQVESGMCVTRDPQRVSCPQQSSLFLKHARLEFRLKNLLCAALQGGWVLSYASVNNSTVTGQQRWGVQVRTKASLSWPLQASRALIYSRQTISTPQTSQPILRWIQERSFWFDIQIHWISLPQPPKAGTSVAPGMPVTRPWAATLPLKRFEVTN